MHSTCCTLYNYSKLTSSFITKFSMTFQNQRRFSISESPSPFLPTNMIMESFRNSQAIRALTLCSLAGTCYDSVCLFKLPFHHLHFSFFYFHYLPVRFLHFLQLFSLALLNLFCLCGFGVLTAYNTMS